jgi:hypothetical protein
MQLQRNVIYVFQNDMRGSAGLLDCLQRGYSCAPILSFPVLGGVHKHRSGGLGWCLETPFEGLQQGMHGILRTSGSTEGRHRTSGRTLLATSPTLTPGDGFW